MDGLSGLDFGNGIKVNDMDKGRDIDARTLAYAGSKVSLRKQEGKIKGKVSVCKDVRVSADVADVSEEGERGEWQRVGPRGSREASASQQRRAGRVEREAERTPAPPAERRKTEEKGEGKYAEKSREEQKGDGGEGGKQMKGDGSRKEDAEKVSKINKEKDGKIEEGIKAQVEDVSYDKEKTVVLELQGQEQVSALELMRGVRGLCGGIIACRATGPRTFEVTMSHIKGKERLLDGFKIKETTILAKGLCNDELVVSFLNLPAYILDEEILKKLDSWGVTAASPIRRRMWPGTKIADGTRFLKVKFNDNVQSLPYSAKFETAIGPEYFRVIHDRQVRVCRMCLQPGHILRDCPEFMCHKCGTQGHYARECTAVKGGRGEKKCGVCFNSMEECLCNESEGDRDSDTAEEESMEQEESEEENLESLRDLAEGGDRPQGAERKAGVGVRPDLASKKAGVGVRPDSADRKADVGVRPDLASKKAGVGVRPDLADQQTEDDEMPIVTGPRTPLEPQGGRSRVGHPPRAGLHRECEHEDEELPSAQGEKNELKRPVSPESEIGSLDSSESEMDLGLIAKVRRNLGRNRRKGKKI